MNYLDLTLGLIVKDSKILLGMKKRGFGEGKWNGFGGKVVEGETLESCLVREFKEEACIDVSIEHKVGIMDFHLEHDNLIRRVHIFRCSFKEGIPIETDEMKPQWFDFKNIPFENMWKSDSVWYPLFLDKQKFLGELWFKNENKDIKKYTIQVVDKL